MRSIAQRGHNRVFTSRLLRHFDDETRARGAVRSADVFAQRAAMLAASAGFFARSRRGSIPSMDTPRSSQRGSEFWSFLGFLCRRVLGLSLVRSEGSGPAADGPLAASTATTPRERSAGSQSVFCRLFACQRGSDTPGADRADAAGGCIQRGAPFGLSPSATSRRGVAASSSRSPRYRRAGGTSSRDLAEVSPLLFGLIGHSDRYLTALGEVHIEPDSTNGS